jgi:hypothetical protein
MAVDINGDGLIALGGTSTTQGRVRLAEDTDNGTNYVELTSNAAVTSNRTVTFPDADIDFTTGLGVAQGGTGVNAAGTTGNVLTSNGTAWVSQAAAAGGGNYVMQVYTSPATWTKPATVKAVKITLVGGGGGGAGTGHPAGGRGGGGGAGGGAIGYVPAPSIPGPVTVTVGAGGTTTTGSGGSGGTSSFGPFISATGGGGGTFVIGSDGVGGAGGAGVPSPTVSIVMTGGAGSSAISGCAGNHSGAGGSLSNRSSTALFGLPSGSTSPALTAIAQSGEYAGIWGLAGAGRLASTPTSPGLAASGRGSGGGGAAGSPQQVPGGVGTGGMIIVEEFY